MGFRTFFESSGGPKIEVSGSDGTGSSAYSPLFFAAIREMASAMDVHLGKIPEEARPSEIDLTYSLRALPTGGFAIVQRSDSANFHITMRWSSPGALPAAAADLGASGTTIAR